MMPFESDSPQPIAFGLQVEQRTPPERHLRPILLVALLVLVVGSATLLAWWPHSSPVSTLLTTSPASQGSPSPSAQPTLTWSADHVDVILSPGETASRSLTLTTNRTVGGLRFCVSPALLPLLRVHVLEKTADDERDIDQNEANDANSAGCNKNHFQLKTGSSRSVELISTIPASVALGTYEGTVEIHHGTQTLTQTLKVVVDAWQKAIASNGSLAVWFPPGFSASDDISASGVETLLISQVREAADVAIQINIASAPLNFASLSDLDPVLSPNRLISRQNLTVAGETAVRFELATPEGIMVQYDILHSGVLIEISTIVTTSTEATMRPLVDKVVSSIQL